MGADRSRPGIARSRRARIRRVASLPAGLAAGLSAVLLLLPLVGCRSAKPVTVRGEKAVTFQAEVADSALRRGMGLMFRGELPVDRGMLFVFPASAPRSFWMLHTRVPLDIIFIDEERRILNIEEAAPCGAPPCRRYVSRGAARYVLEINRGLSRRYGFHPGLPVEFDP